MNTETIDDCLQRMLQFARNLSDPASGRMRDCYETEYGENFSPACFSMIAAARYRLHGRPEDREWALRWGHRSAAIMRESPYMREYMLGYTAMIFGLLDPDEELEALRQDYVAASLPAEELSPFAHILALQLNGDLLCPRGPASLERAETIVDMLEGLWTPEGFPEDQMETDDGSIPHAYLTVANLAVFLIARPLSESAQKLQPRIEALIARACDWFHQVNGTAMVAAQANRSYNQLWTYPLYALLAYVHRGERATPAIERCRAIVDRATGRMSRPNFLPTTLSPYAGAGNEPYNRVNNDIGAGGVGWALLAVLQATGFKGLAARVPDLSPVFVDEAAGYARFHGAASGMLLPTRTHHWHYHYPLQPAWMVIKGDGGPFVGAKRAGVNNRYAALIAEPSKVDPLLEPYFGITAEVDGIHHVMQEPVELRSENTLCAVLRPEGSSPSCAAARVTVEVEADAGALTLTYRLEGGGAGELWLSIPVLLWNGTDELDYRIEASRVELRWQSRLYSLTATVLTEDDDAREPPASWILRRERFQQTGFGITGNFALALRSASAVRVCLEAG